MTTHKVDCSQWHDCLSQFSRAHHGQNVNIETLTPDIGIRCNVASLPLMGVTLEPDPREFRRVTIAAGNAQSGVFTHTVSHPSEIRTAEWNDGVSSVLDIETLDGEITRLRVGPQEQVLPAGMITDDLWKRE